MATALAPTPLSPFERYDSADVAQLIIEYPLAWVVDPASEDADGALLPLIAEHDPSGAVTALIGHIPRNWPLCDALRRAPSALILFNGPQGYVSPSDVEDRSWVPTWNFAQVRVMARLCFLEDEASGDHALSTLIEAMEAPRSNPWQAREVGQRYRSMERRVVAFRADDLRIRGRFKLAQDERPEILRRMIERLDDPALVKWIRRFNSDRI